MRRDPAAFPDDENGDVLRRMHRERDDLSIPRESDLSVTFPTEDAALRFAVHLPRNGPKVSFSAYEGDEMMPWQVHAHPFMVPTHANISGDERQLDVDAAAVGGRNDGWGCFSQGS